MGDTTMEGDPMATEAKAGGKRWGLKQSRNPYGGVKGWLSVDSDEEFTMVTVSPDKVHYFDSPHAAEHHRTTAVVEPCRREFNVVHYDTGEIIHPEDPRLKPRPVDHQSAKTGLLGPGTIRVVKGEHAGKVGKYISTDRTGDVYCVIGGRCHGLPGDNVEVGPLVEEDDAVDDEPDDMADDSPDDPTTGDFLMIDRADAEHLRRILHAGARALGEGRTLSVAHAFGRMEGLLAGLGFWGYEEDDE